MRWIKINKDVWVNPEEVLAVTVDPRAANTTGILLRGNETRILLYESVQEVMDKLLPYSEGTGGGILHFANKTEEPEGNPLDESDHRERMVTYRDDDRNIFRLRWCRDENWHIFLHSDETEEPCEYGSPLSKWNETYTIAFA